MASTATMLPSGSVPSCDTGVQEWPLLTFKEFTIFTLNKLKSGDTEDSQIPMKQKYNSYCADYEMICNFPRATMDGIATLIVLS